MIELLIYLLVLVIVCAVIYYILTLIPLPAPWRQIVLAIFALIVLLIVLSMLLPQLGYGLHGPLLRG